MKIDLLMVNYNSTDSLITCLESIQTVFSFSDLNIWVWDNHSKDEPSRIPHCFPNVKLLSDGRNIGFGAAVNRLISKSKAPFVMLLNPDTAFNDGRFSNLLNYIKDHPDVGVIGLRILNPDGSLQESARSFPNILSGLFGRTSLLTRLFPHNRFSRKNLLSGAVEESGTPVDVDWVSGACMIVRRKAIETVGGMDERFFMYWEDADWCRRMWRKRWRVVYFPGASLYHSVGQSSRTRAIRSMLEFHKSAFRLYEKYARGYRILLKPIVFWALAMRFYVNVIKLLLYPREHKRKGNCY